MKKRWICAAAAALALTIGATSAMALGSQGRYVDANGDGVCDNRGTSAWCTGYVDANGDGICDNHGTNVWCTGYVDANGDGVCDNRGTNGQGAGYVDADGDGICDNRPAGGCMGGQGRMGRHAGGGCAR